jgi:hypothetical protein
MVLAGSAGIQFVVASCLRDKGGLWCLFSYYDQTLQLTILAGHRRDAYGQDGRVSRRKPEGKSGRLQGLKVYDEGTCDSTGGERGE